MPSWRDRAAPATFRGVPFHVDASEVTAGRRTAKHEFPLRDAPFIEDMGRRARSFNVDGYVIGSDYIIRRDALLAALEERGPGELIHPYYGARRVIASDVRVRDSTDRGGMAQFGITFEETDVAPAFPVVVPARPDAVVEAADLLDVAIEADFAADYLTAGQPATALESLSGLVASAGGALSAALAPIITARQVAAALKRDLDELVLDADALVREPFKVVGALRAVLVSLAEPPLRPSLALSALLVAYGFTPATSRPPSTTALRRREQANWDALLRMIRAAVLAQAARLTAAEAWESYDAAVAAREAVCAAIDEQLPTFPDATFEAFGRLRAGLVEAVPGEDEDLPRIVRYAPPGTIPSLVLAQRLYGAVEQEADLVARNRVAFPGFVMGGATLEVLSRG